MAEENIDRGPLGDAAAGPENAARRSVQPLIVAAIVIAGLYFGRRVFEPLALAVLFSLMLAPLGRWLGHRVGRVPAVLLSVLAASVLMLGVLAAVAEQAIGLLENLPRYEENIAVKIRSLGNGAGANMLDRANQVFQDLLGQLSDAAGYSAPAVSGGVPGEADAPLPVVIRPRTPGPLDFLQGRCRAAAVPDRAYRAGDFPGRADPAEPRGSAGPVITARRRPRSAPHDRRDERSRRADQPLSADAARRRVVFWHPVRDRAGGDRHPECAALGRARGGVPVRPVYRRAADGGVSDRAGNRGRSRMGSAVVDRPAVCRSSRSSRT